MREYKFTVGDGVKLEALLLAIEQGSAPRIGNIGNDAPTRFDGHAKQVGREVSVWLYDEADGGDFVDASEDTAMVAAAVSFGAALIEIVPDTI